MISILRVIARLAWMPIAGITDDLLVRGGWKWRPPTGPSQWRRR